MQQEQERERERESKTTQGKPERILIICLDNIGDLVFVSNLADVIYVQMEKAEIYLLCKEYARDVGELFPHVRQVFSCDPFWDASPGRKRGGFFAYFKTLRRLRQLDLHKIIVTSKSWKVACSAWLIGAPRRIGFHRIKAAPFLTDACPRPPSTLPEVIRLQQLLEPLKINAAHHHYILDAQKLHAERERLSVRLDASRLAVLHAFAGSPKKRWALHHWLHLAELLRAKNFQILWVGQPKELEELKNATGLQFAHELPEFFEIKSFRETCAAISLAKIFIGHDSGPMHVAGALNIPVLAFYLPGDPVRTVPQGLNTKHFIAHPRAEDLSFAEVEEALGKTFGLVLK